MNIQDLKQFDFLVGNYDSYIVIGVSSKFTLEVFNVNTWNEETIEGDYYENGNIEWFTNKGNVENYISNLDKRAVEYKEKLTNKVKELKEYYN